MIRRALAGIFAAILLTGCQAAGPGIQVQVRAEPKAGYTPPAAGNVGYGGSDLPTAEVHDHDFHLIDYRQLDGVVVFVEPAGGATAAGTPPLDVAVNLFKTYPGNVNLASVGGRVTLNGPQTSGSYLLRTDSGQLIDVPADKPVYVPAKPGMVEILGDESDDPVATIFVSPTPWAKKTVAPQGATFAPLPEGKYRVTAWHPILPGSSQVVDVGPGALSKLTLTVGVNSLPKPK
jgi:hypothetical protein